MARTQQEIEDRRARIAQLHAEGRVMTDSMRTRQKKARQKQDKLEEMAESVIASLNGSPIASGRYNDISATVVEKKPVPEANSYLSANKKQDVLAATASRVLQEILNS